MSPLARTMMEVGAAAGIPAGASGLWNVRKIHVRTGGVFPDGENCPVGHYTALTRYTDETLHSWGETVMADNPIELRKHLPAAIAARGRVLVTGLGLACVVRMMQANPRVERITVIENSKDVIRLVWPHTSHSRVELIVSEAQRYLRRTRQTWDCAWHDIWTDRDRGEPHLAVAHQQLMIAAMRRVKFQGAWAFPRNHKRDFNRLVRRILA